jgi:hypothetical protein
VDDEFADLASLPLFAVRRQVLESRTFTEQLAAIGPLPRLDDALAAIHLILTENAEVYPVLKGYGKTRLAKTRAVEDVPALNIWFVLQDEEVLLLYVEPVPGE